MKRAESDGASSPRVLSAPFQGRAVEGSPSAPSNPSTTTDYVDFTCHKFKGLEDLNSLAFANYCGPTPESNWVIPGVLLVGAYPATQDDEETIDLITSILKLGVTKFVCLQQEYREFGVTKHMWKTGQALRPYFEDVREIVKAKASHYQLEGFEIVSEENLSFVHFPIKDCGITDDSGVLDLAKRLVKCISEGEIIYLHCWGGHGRTGTVVCIMLYLMYGLDPKEAMKRCQRVHDIRRCPVVVGSPQTQPQRDQVTRVINRLISLAKAGGGGGGTSPRSASEPIPKSASLVDDTHSPRPEHAGSNVTSTAQSREPTAENVAKMAAVAAASVVPPVIHGAGPPLTVPSPLGGPETAAPAQPSPIKLRRLPSVDMEQAMESARQSEARTREPMDEDELDNCVRLPSPVEPS